NSDIPPKNRLVMEVVSPANVGQAKISQGRKMTGPIVVFLAIVIAAIGLAYILENLKPRRRPVPAAPSEGALESAARTEPPLAHAGVVGTAKATRSQA